MQTTTDRNPITYPVDDTTYNLLSALNEKLEGLAAYRKYYEDDPEGEVGQLFRALADEDARHAERLLDALRKQLS
jgi:hypothetical protein